MFGLTTEHIMYCCDNTISRLKNADSSLAQRKATMEYSQQATRQHIIYEFDNKPSKALLREIILYIASVCICDESFGATKLNKILYFADFMSYAQHGEPITGVAYQRLPNGPAPVLLVPIREELKANGDIAISRQSYYGYPQERIVALHEANLEKFKPRDIALVDFVISHLSSHNATDVSFMSHGRAWRAVRDKEKIPYNYAFLSNEGITQLDIQLTQDVLHEIGWGNA